MEKIFGIATQGLAKVSNFLKMTNDKFPTGGNPPIRSICHLSFRVRGEPGSLGVPRSERKWSKIRLQRDCRCPSL